jgi:hypothetical protein
MREHFPEYREEALDRQENYYDLSQILIDIYNNIYDNEKNGKTSDRELGSTAIGNRWLVRDSMLHVFLNTDNANDARPEKLQAILEVIYHDPILQRDMKKLASIHKILEGDAERFSEKMRILSEKIEIRSGE